MFICGPAWARGRLAKVLYRSVALGALSCSAVLGLDEPTHRTDGGITPGGAGASMGTAGNGVGAGGSNPGSGGSNAGGVGGASAGGAAGASAAGASGAGGATPAPDAGGTGGVRDAGTDAGRVGCQGLPLCDDFEAPAVGAVPDQTKWAIDPNTIPPILISIDGSIFRSGKKSVHVLSANGSAGPMLFSNKTALAIGSIWYVRFHAFVKDPNTTDPNSATGLMAIRDMKNPSRHLVLGTTNSSLAYFFFQPGAPGLPVVPSDAVRLAQSFRVTDSKWFCVEMKLDASSGTSTIQTWVDGNDITVLTADAMPTPGIDDTWASTVPFQPMPFVGFGTWPSTTGAVSSIYVDDVAVAASRIGCN